MRGTDGIVAWLDRQKNVHFYDIHINNDERLRVDHEQNCELLQMSEKNGSTSLLFRRMFRTSDPSDLTINTDTTVVQWGWGIDDPDKLEDISLSSSTG